MELLLIRHGLPVRHASAGGADPELAPDGVAQAEHLGEYLAVEAITAIYVSPLRRARETAAPLAAALGIEVVRRTGSPSGTATPTSTCPSRS